jgi:Zn finger protein HypA/HybF involved in hydrogenase expression
MSNVKMEAMRTMFESVDRGATRLGHRMGDFHYVRNAQWEAKCYKCGDVIVANDETLETYGDALCELCPYEDEA